MGGSVMFACTATLPLDNKPLKVNLLHKSTSDTVLPKTMEHSAYVPRVENISPALPSDDVKEEAALQATKDGLLNQITNIDKKIAQTEEEIKHLGTKLQELQEAADISKGASKEEDDKKPQSPTLAIKIYTENKKKRQAGNKLWVKLGPKIDIPLYNQPSDTAIYHENRRKHMVFRYCLLKFLKFKQAETSAQENYLIALYMEKKQDWLNKVKAIESSLAHKKKEAEKKIIFEKEFPKLRKQIEEKRKQRLSQIESHFGTADKSRSTCAIICPILLPSRVQEYKYIDNNGLVKDLTAEYKEWQLINMWTDTEKAIFKEKFLQHPKQFGVIASYLDHKSIRECVKYYYLSKQTENYKSLLRKSRKRAHLNCNGLPAKRANTGQLNLGKVQCLQAGKESRQDLRTITVAVNSTTDNGVQGSLVQVVQQTSLVDSMTSKSTAPISSPAPTSGERTFNVDSELESVDLLQDLGSKKVESSRSTLENTGGHQLSHLTQSVTDCEPENHKEDARVVLETIKTEELKNIDTKCDIQKGIVESIMLDHSKQLPHSDVSQYSMCEEQALLGGQVPSTCNCKFRGGCYTHCQVLTYQCSQSQAHRCLTQWTDTQHQALINGESKVLQPNMNSNSGSVNTLRGVYGVATLGNMESVSIERDSNIPGGTLQAKVHGVEDPAVGSQHPCVLTKSCDMQYRRAVIKAAGRCCEAPSDVEVSLRNKPLEMDIGVPQPLTSTVTEGDLLGVSAREDVSKQVHSVKDLLMEVIEKQIMKNFDSCDEVGISSVEGKGPLTPTLSSILQTHRVTGRSHSNFVSGFQSGDNNRNLHLSGNLLVPTSHKQMLPLDQKQHASQMNACQLIPNSRSAALEYAPERKEAKIPCSRSFLDGNDRKHCFQDDSVVASHHRPPPLLPTPIHQTHYSLASMPHVAVHTTPRSSVTYSSRGTVTAVQDIDGTLDLSTKKLRAYNHPGLSCEGFSRQQTSQDQPMYHLSPQLPHYLSQPTVHTAQRNVHPREFVPTVSSPSTLVHRSRYGSVISPPVGREQVHSFTAPSNMSDGRVTNVSPGCTSSLSAYDYTPHVKAMINMYKPYFP